MSLFVRRRERRSLDSLADILAETRGTVSWAGVPVTTDTAMRQSVVWACVNLIADLGATLPVGAYRRGTSVPLDPVVPPPPIVAKPSEVVDATSWRRQVFLSWLLRGNVFGIVQQLRNGWPTMIELLNPDQVRVRQPTRGGPPEFTVNGERVERWPAGDLWHVPGLVLPGSPLGVSVIEHAAQTIGTRTAAQQFGARWFDSGAHPSAILKTDQRIDEEQARLIKERFIAAVRGRREPAVLGLGLDYQPIQVDAADAKFLETIAAHAEDIVRFFFPSFVLSIGQSSITYQNVEQRGLNLLTYDLDPWFVRLERAMTNLLPRDQYVRITRDALLRTDTLTRYRLHDLALRGGWKNRDEIRAKEELPPIPGGEGNEYLWPPYRTSIEEDQ